jgi:hypothetical protein
VGSAYKSARNDTAGSARRVYRSSARGPFLRRLSQSVAIYLLSWSRNVASRDYAGTSRDTLTNATGTRGVGAGKYNSSILATQEPGPIKTTRQRERDKGYETKKDPPKKIVGLRFLLGSRHGYVRLFRVSERKRNRNINLRR